jgi:hypothetical protein
VRLRVDNLLSQPLFYNGGNATMPPTIYRFEISPNGNGLLLTPHQ